MLFPKYPSTKNEYRRNSPPQATVYYLINYIDTKLFYMINRTAAHPLADILMPFFSYLGNYGAVWLILGLIGGTQNDRGIEQPFGIVLLSLLTAHLLTEGLIKPFFRRSRPFETLPQTRLLISKPPSSKSFPSGHALTSYTCATILSHLYTGLAPYFYFLAGCIALSRVYVGVHYPGDVIAGKEMGLLLGSLIKYRLNINR